MPNAETQPIVAIAMLAAIVMVTGLAWWDAKREADNALEDLQTEQSVLASSVAGGLRARLASIERDAESIEVLDAERILGRYDPARIRSAATPPAKSADPSRFVLSAPLPDGRFVDLGVGVEDVLDGAAHVVAARDLTVLVSPPGALALYGLDGRVVSSPPIRDALDRDLTAVRLDRGEASRVGLRERTAMAGLAHVDAGALGHWDVVTVASAARERDREKRAVWRLVLSVLVASGLVIVFGGVALRKQRKGLELAHRLTVSELEHERDEKLMNAERVATMGTFAMGIAHEVSTPLGVIVGRAEQLLGRLREDDRSSRAAQTILEQADRIQHIVRRFLDMARGGPLSFAKIDPAVVMRTASAALEHRFAKANVSLRTDIPDSMPLIQCDRDLLEHALVNLLLNACEASAPGGHVELTARSDAQRVAFIVADDGVGISPEDAARAAEPFFTTKSGAQGSGLGLAIATEITKSHRGDLTIGANADKGTRACIEIPIATSPHARAPADGGRGAWQGGQHA